MAMKQLNNQEQIFVDEYLVSLNPEKAALAAKYAATTARTKAYQWVSNSEQNPKPYIYQAIQKKMAAQSEKTGIKAERVVEVYRYFCCWRRFRYAIWSNFWTRREPLCQ